MKRLFICCLAVICAAACNKQKVQDEMFTVLAGLPTQETKTSLGGKSGNLWPLVWSEGDCLYVNGVQSSPLSSSEAGAASATFKFAGVGGASKWNYTYCGVPGSDCKVVFPSSQSSSNGNISMNALPMYASSSSVSGITLVPLGCVLRFSLSSSSAVMVSQIKISAVGGESISGIYSIGKSGAGLLNGALTPDGDNRDNIVVAAGVTLSSSPQAFCIVVPGGYYSSGFKADITASSGDIMEVWFNTKSDKTLSPGTLYDFAQAEFVPMGSSVMAVMGIEQFVVETVNY